MSHPSQSMLLANRVSRPWRRGERLLYTAAVVIVLAAGAFLRLHQWAMFTGIGFDEHLYVKYTELVSRAGGLAHYPDVVDKYIEEQTKLTGSILPPTRFLYIFFGYAWHAVFGGNPIAAFHSVSRLFSVLMLPISFLFARRLAGRGAALGVLALMSCSPLEIHMSQHALVDGFFAFWALLTLWALWENLQEPGRLVWQATYAAAMAAMVLTKENAFFVFLGCVVILGANRWLHLGKVTRATLLLTVLGPLTGVLILTFLAGGVSTLIHVYTLGVSKNLQLEYAILTGDGPWYRYLIDLMLISPLVMVVALGAAFHVRRKDKALLFLMLFIGASFAIMANLKYGMNLRYATIWDMPLRTMAFLGLVTQSERFGRHGRIALIVFVAGFCAFDLWQYERLAVAYPLYELVPQDLLRALNILK